jgi:MerR family transcriptional regulator, Zn(II)-responsive regulator of zntA
MDSERSLMPTQLARLGGVSTDTLRHYERMGLLSPGRQANGYRQYSPESLARVQLIQHALTAGFTLEELARLLKERDRGGTPCREVRVLASSKLEKLERVIKELSGLRDGIRAMLKDWDARLAKTPAGKRAWLLESLSEKPVTLEEAASHKARLGIRGRSEKTSRGRGEKP